MKEMGRESLYYVTAVHAYIYIKYSQQSLSPPSPFVRFVNFLTGNPEYATGPSGAIRDVISVRVPTRQLYQSVTYNMWQA